jgi:hypothetical protein
MGNICTCFSPRSDESYNLKYDSTSNDSSSNDEIEIFSSSALKTLDEICVSVEHQFSKFTGSDSSE